MSVCVLVLGGACGARNALFVSEADSDANMGMTGERPKATSDAGATVTADAVPAIDATVGEAPALDGCANVAATRIFLISQENELLSFEPLTLSFASIGKIACPGTSATPASMAVDRRGIAYTCFSDGNLFALNTASGSCTATNFVRDQKGFSTFGMGYAALSDGGDRLYVVDYNGRVAPTTLGWIDTSSFTLSVIGTLQPAEQTCELTGTGDGRLFGFCLLPAGGSMILQIDPNDGRVVAQNKLNAGQPNNGWAFAYWGGVFWLFTGDGRTSLVTRWDPTTGTETNVSTRPGSIVGAGVSTCAPNP